MRTGEDSDVLKGSNGNGIPGVCGVGVLRGAGRMELPPPREAWAAFLPGPVANGCRVGPPERLPPSSGEASQDNRSGQAALSLRGPHGGAPQAGAGRGGKSHSGCPGSRAPLPLPALLPRPILTTARAAAAPSRDNGGRARCPQGTARISRGSQQPLEGGLGRGDTEPRCAADPTGSAREPLRPVGPRARCRESPWPGQALLGVAPLFSPREEPRQGAPRPCPLSAREDRAAPRLPGKRQALPL